MHLDGATAVVTGGASGLGAATATLLARHGARVVITDLPTSNGAEVGKAIGSGAEFVPADVTDGSLEGVFERARSRGIIRAVVHCAGRGGDRRRILDRDLRPSPLDSFTEVLRVNTVGTYNVLRLAAAQMAENDLDDDGDRGAIVLTASVAAFDGQIGQTSYTASKAAVHGMTLVAARDLATYGIRVNTIAPGVFDTPMLGRLPDKIRDALSEGVPHPRRLGNPADYAAMAEALLTNSYVNGETVRLDGAIRLAPR